MLYQEIGLDLLAPAYCKQSALGLFESGNETKKKVGSLTHSSYLNFILFSTSLDNFISKAFSHDIY